MPQQPQLLRHLQAGRVLSVTVLVSVETALLIIVALLVAGMLRTHADIMRALNLSPVEDRQQPQPQELPPSRTGPPADVDEQLTVPAAPLEGVNLDLRPVSVEMKRDGDAPRLLDERLSRLPAFLERAVEPYEPTVDATWRQAHPGGKGSGRGERRQASATSTC